jgi:hypothetical protein
MVTATRLRQTLHATLCEVESGVFYVTYPDCTSGANELTTYQTGTCAADAKQEIERCAYALGYDTVIWMESITAPLFASPAKIALHNPAARYTARLTG